MKQVILLSIFIWLINVSSALCQESVCNERLKEKVEIDLQQPSIDLDEFMTDMADVMITCGDFDSLDVQILISPLTLGAMLVQMETKSNLTYNFFLSGFNSLKQEPDYEVVRRLMANSNKLELLTVSSENWNNAKSILHSMNMSNETIQLVEEFSENSTQEDQTYLDILQIVTKSIDEDTKELDSIENPFLNFSNEVVCKSYDDAISVSTKLGKPMLLYFTGWTCVNCRRMEEEVLSDKDISGYMLDNYVLLMLYTDDMSILQSDEVYVSEETGKTIDTVGKRNVDLEISKFNKNWQPFFVIVDSNEDVLNEVGYKKDKTLFMEFLKRK